jgi:hypothetical protein
MVQRPTWPGLPKRQCWTLFFAGWIGQRPAGPCSLAGPSWLRRRRNKVEQLGRGNTVAMAHGTEKGPALSAAKGRREGWGPHWRG